MNVELSGKRTELLMETLPTAKRIEVLTNSCDPINAPQLKEISRAAGGGRITLEILNARDPKDLQEFTRLYHENPLDAMTLISSQLFAGH